jgi:hypothetical protein
MVLDYRKLVRNFRVYTTKTNMSSQARFDGSASSTYIVNVYNVFGITARDKQAKPALRTPI